MSFPIADIGVGAGVVGALVAVDSWFHRRHLNSQDKALGEIHVLVNSRLEEALQRIDLLEEALHLATGIPKELISADPSPGTPTEPPPA